MAAILNGMDIAAIVICKHVYCEAIEKRTQMDTEGVTSW
jgi:hypothetical protein